ncbi:hypothetical protein N7462_006290 [Penicillium macrosclerotiorum]|uniref:uncharacterized protein n=1 Tax=Penicillium macrosclerotiorum TaxID=303699 RepID=UPI002549984F|nr:uncharacterized protein N7462_006290 [Penicillium macrosclerotiorum]KAJ5683125.1 hypothetical protein N7462_006290 [Penicillium macrosclerotiorum]
MEQSILRLETELQKQYGNEDWSTTFRAGPDSIGILAECILITSRPMVIGIELKGPGLEYTTLSANVSHCADVGAVTFRTTARNMKTLAQLTNKLSQPNGTGSEQIEKMLKFCEVGQSQARDRLLSKYISRGEKIVANCTDLIGEVSTLFDDWCTMTAALYHALQDTLGQKRRQEQHVIDEIKKNEVDKELKEGQREKEEARTNERAKRMQETRETKAMYEKYAGIIASSSVLAEGGLTAVVASASAVTTGVGLAVAGATAYIHYRTLRADLMSMEEAQERRNQEIRELEVSKAILEQTLAHLSAESKSIDEVKQIVQLSFRKVTELQQLVRKFMQFLLDINTIIEYTVEHSTLVYDIVKDKEDLIDPGVKMELLENAFDMKTRFIFASKASSVYNAVSSQFILPTLNKIPELGLLNEATEREVMTKMEELHDLRCRVCTETTSLTQRMHAELKESLAEVTRTSARVFEDIASGDRDGPGEGSR